MTHAELVQRAARWLAGTQRCVVVLREASSQCVREYPDAIGWTARGLSTLVECKVSRHDFFSDKRKGFRAQPEFGAGVHRYYMTPRGLVTVDEVPDGWGLVEVRGSVCRVVRRSAVFEANRSVETALLAAETQRVAKGWRLPGGDVGLYEVPA